MFCLKFFPVMLRMLPQQQQPATSVSNFLIITDIVIHTKYKSTMSSLGSLHPDCLANCCCHLQSFTHLLFHTLFCVASIKYLIQMLLLLLLLIRIVLLPFKLMLLVRRFKCCCCYFNAKYWSVCVCLKSVLAGWAVVYFKFAVLSKGKQNGTLCTNEF